MSNNDRPNLNRFVLGEMPVINQEGRNRVLERTGLSLVTEMPVEAFHYFLNEVVQFAIDHWLVPKVTRAQIDRLRVCFEKFEEQSIALQRQGVLVPTFPHHWVIQTNQFFDDFTMSGKQSHGFTYLPFCVHTIGLFHAAFGVWPTSTTAESDVHADGPLARFAYQTLQELVSFKNRVTVDQELVRVHLMLRSDLLDRLVASQRFQSDLGLKPVCKLPPFRHSRIPSKLWDTPPPAVRFSGTSSINCVTGRPSLLLNSFYAFPA